jgi:hypothetical protein
MNEWVLLSESGVLGNYSSPDTTAGGYGVPYNNAPDVAAQVGNPNEKKKFKPGALIAAVILMILGIIGVVYGISIIL